MNGVELIALERERQMRVEGWTPEHDDGHCRGEIVSAAMCYAECGRSIPLGASLWRLFSCDWAARCWPWEVRWWKPSEDPVRNLVKAGALIAAEIDRLQRVAEVGE